MNASETNLDNHLVSPPATVLVVGATGSIGRLVVAEALKQGYAVRTLVRNVAKARRLLPPQAQIIECQVTQTQGLAEAIGKVDAVVFTLGAGSVRGESAMAVDYGGVFNVMNAVSDQKPRVSLMTAIGVTKRVDVALGTLEAHDWKRRSERVVRASGCPYTIVRPGWFDYNTSHQHRLVLLQGDTRWASDPSDGVVSREQIAQVLVRSLSTSNATCKTVELVAENGAATQDFEELFSSTQADADGALDGCGDKSNMPLADEPEWVRDHLKTRLSLRV